MLELYVDFNDIEHHADHSSIIIAKQVQPEYLSHDEDLMDSLVLVQDYEGHTCSGKVTEMHRVPGLFYVVLDLSTFKGLLHDEC